MRRLLATAIIAGLAFGAALNLLVWPERPPTSTEAAVTGARPESEPSDLGPASHSDSNTAGKHVALNSNVIQGLTTTVCYTSRAAELWAETLLGQGQLPTPEEEAFDRVVATGVALEI